MADQPSFKGIHNHRKVVVLACLMLYNHPLTLRELAQRSNTSYDYLRVRMNKFTRWSYVRKVAVLRGGVAYPAWRLSNKGREYLMEKTPVSLLEDYIQQLESLRGKLEGQEIKSHLPTGG